MAKITSAQKNEMVKAQTITQLAINTEADGVIRVGDFKYAFRTEVDGEERWAEVTVVAKNNKDTATSEAYDPFQAEADWKFDKEQATKKKAEADRVHAEKVAKSKKKKKEVAE